MVNIWQSDNVTKSPSNYPDDRFCKNYSKKDRRMTFVDLVFCQARYKPEGRTFTRLRNGPHCKNGISNDNQILLNFLAKRESLDCKGKSRYQTS